MSKTKKELIVLSLGGSIVVPGEINIKFLKRFKGLLLRKIKNGQRFIIVVGGGKTARNYQNAADKVSKLNNEDLDWLGIHSTRLNAHLLRTIFRKYADPVINTNPTKASKFKEDILIAAGWKPGFSTDFDAVILAKKYGAKKVINMSNIDYVYDIDPRKSVLAKPLPNLSWKEYRKLVGNKWHPGSNAPFDPIASKKAENFGLKVVILNGSNLTNFNNYLNNKKFKGTVIDK
jgi:uridylate kinase